MLEACLSLQAVICRRKASTKTRLQNGGLELVISHGFAGSDNPMGPMMGNQNHAFLRNTFSAQGSILTTLLGTGCLAHMYEQHL